MALLDLQAQQGIQAKQVPLEQQVHQVQLDPEVILGLLEQLETRDLWEVQEQQEKQVPQATLDIQVKQELQVKQALLENKAQRAKQDQLEQKDLQVKQALLENKAQRAKQDQLEQKDLQVKQALLAHKAHRELRLASYSTLILIIKPMLGLHSLPQCLLQQIQVLRRQ
jgi:uncharacterized membrane protein YcgQ (UPF0703/DUF1980 family)